MKRFYARKHQPQSHRYMYSSSGNHICQSSIPLGLSHPLLATPYPALPAPAAVPAPALGNGPNHDANQPGFSFSFPFSLFFLRVLASLNNRPPDETCLGGRGEKVTERGVDAPEPGCLSEEGRGESGRRREEGRWLKRAESSILGGRGREACEGSLSVSESSSLAALPAGGVLCVQ
ncbi:hypothetical protein BDV93DRAFT_163449 [Ceratobasidium sp. AG-I]|nr:hypothetical protein BDV93DRAFT_163449 [Ceratobasidium sp. AG-I]